MAAITGQRHQVAFGRNRTDAKATPSVAESVWFKRMSTNFPRRIERETDESSIGSNFKDQDREIMNKFTEPEVGGKVRSHSIGYPILSQCNAAPVSTVDSNVSSVYSHVFTPTDDEVGAGISALLYNPNYTDDFVACNNLKISELMIEVDAQKAWVEFNSSGMAGDFEDATATHSARVYPTEHLFRYHDAVLRLADNNAGLSAAGSIIRSRKYALKFTRDLEKDDLTTAVTPDEYYSTQYGYSLDIEQPFRDDNFLNLFESGAEKVGSLTIINPLINIGTTANPINPSLTILLGRLDLPTYDHSTDIGNTVMTESFSLTGLDIVNPYSFTLVNDREFY